MTDKILRRRDGAIGHLIFNNPEKRNAVSLEMWQAVEAAVADFAGDPDLRVLIVAGAGGRAFVSGADISKFESERASTEAIRAYDAATARAYRAIQEFPRPTIAKIDGFCVGGGVALALCCDLRFCQESSRFAIPAARLGLGYGLSGIKRLVDVVGPAFAKEIFFTARRFTAEEARIMGLVNRVLPDDDLERAVLETAAMIADNAPLTVAAVKAAVGEALKDRAERDTARCERLVAECFASQDYIEGRRAFLEKRKPIFRGA